MTTADESLLKKSFFNFWGLAILLVFVLVFQLVGYGISIYVLSWIFGIETSEVSYLISHPDGSALGINIGRFANLIQFICYMGFPAWLFVLITNSTFKEISGPIHSLNFKRTFWSFALGFSAIPVVSVITAWMKFIPIGGKFETLINKLSQTREALFENMLDMESYSELIFCLVLIAIIPAIFEEFLFRGIVLKIGLKQYSKPIKAIIYQALIFAILHLSFYELPGIIMIGAIFGYVAKETGSIWSGVIGHATFNGITVILHFIVLKQFNSSGIMHNPDELLNNYFLAIPASVVMGLALTQITKSQDK